MTRTARYLGLYVLAIGIALMQPGPWSGLWLYLRKGLLRTVGVTAYNTMAAQSEQDAKIRAIKKAQEDFEAREAMKPKPTKIIPVEVEPIWTRNGRRR